MFCPGCGQKNSSDQRFCRSCGINLEPITTALGELLPADLPPDLERSERRLERFGQIAFGGFGIVIGLAVLGIIYTIFTKMILVGQQPLAGVLLVLFIVFAALTLSYVVFSEDLKEKRKKRYAEFHAPPPMPAEPDTNKLLNELASPSVASVTENTTELLPRQNRQR